MSLRNVPENLLENEPEQDMLIQKISRKFLLKSFIVNGVK